MSLARKGIFDYFAMNAGFLLTFVSGYIFDKYFGPGGRGEYHLILLAYALLPNLVNLGLEISARVFVGKMPDEIAEVHTAGLFLILLITLFVGILLVLCGEPIRKFFFNDVPTNLLLLAVGLLPFALYHMLWQGVFVGLGEIYTYARVNMWNRIAQGAAVIILITFFRPALSWIVWAIVPIQLITFVVTIFLMRRKYRFLAPLSFMMLRRMLSFGWVVYFGNVAVNLLQRIDVFFTSHFYSTSEVGLFGRATMFSDKMVLISGSFERILYAPLATADEKEAVFLIQKAFRHNIVINIVGAFAMYCLATVTLHLLLPEFIGSLVPLKFLLASVIFKSFSSIFAAYFTSYRKKPIIPGLINWMVLPLHGALCWILVQSNGIVGASVATAITFLIHSSLFYIFFRVMSTGANLGEMIIPQKGDLDYYLRPLSILKRGKKKSE